MIILAEISFNAGWRDFAVGMKRFSDSEVSCTRLPTPKAINTNSSCFDTERLGKWPTKETQILGTSSSSNRAIIKGGSTLSNGDFLDRGVVGRFGKDLHDVPTAS